MKIRALVTWAWLSCGAFAQSVPGRFPQALPKIPAKPEPPGYRLPAENLPTVELEAPSAAEIAPRPRYGARQIGVRRLLSSPVTPAIDITSTGVRAARFAVHSPGASALRLHFVHFAAGEGQVWIYNLAALAISGPYTARGPNHNGSFWSAPVSADSVIVEYDFPKPSASSVLPFAIEAVSHEWSGVLPHTDTVVDTAAGCELDVACYPAYVTYATGVPMYTFLSDSGGAYACSGAMVNNTGQYFEPYMLTANHCIGSDTEAQSIAAFFGYQSQSCGGFEPDIRQLSPVLGGSYLAGADISQGDFTLVKLPQLTPGTFIFLAGPPQNRR